MTLETMHSPCMRQSPSREANSCSLNKEFPHVFMEPEGSLLFLKEDVTGLYVEVRRIQSAQSYPIYFGLLLLSYKNLQFYFSDFLTGSYLRFPYNSCVLLAHPFCAL